MSKTISLRLDDQMFEELNIISERTGRTKSFYLTEALKKYLPQIQNLSDFDEEISRETLAEIQQFESDLANNKVELISLEEFEKELNV